MKSNVVSSRGVLRDFFIRLILYGFIYLTPPLRGSSFFRGASGLTVAPVPGKAADERNKN